MVNFGPILEPFGSFSCVSLIGIRPGMVSYHSPGPSPRFKGEKGGEDLGRGSFGGVLGGLGNVVAKVLVLSASSGAYS